MISFTCNKDSLWKQLVIANLVCDVGWNKVLIRHQVHHNRVPHVPVDTDRLVVNIHLHIFLAVTNILFNNQPWKAMLHGNSQSIFALYVLSLFSYAHTMLLLNKRTQNKTILGINSVLSNRRKAFCKLQTGNRRLPPATTVIKQTKNCYWSSRGAVNISKPCERLSSDYLERVWLCG